MAPKLPPDARVAYALLGSCGLGSFLLGSARGVVAVGVLIVALTGRHAYIRAQGGPSGFLLEVRRHLAPDDQSDNEDEDELSPGT